jgi:uncharacterized protein (TIGR02466 family)
MTQVRFAHEGLSLLFATPLVSYQVDDAENLNAMLLQEIAVRRQLDPVVTRSNRGGWASEADFFARSEPGHRALGAAIRDAVVHATMSIGDNPQRLQSASYRTVGWVNVSPPQAYHAPHDHPGSFWAGVYYVANAPGKDADDIGGAITFLDPRCAPAGQAIVRAPVHVGTHTVRPTPGLLLLFPGTAKHWVHPNNSGTDRVTVAFNVALAGQGQSR